MYAIQCPLSNTSLSLFAINTFLASYDFCYTYFFIILRTYNTTCAAAKMSEK